MRLVVALVAVGFAFLYGTAGAQAAALNIGTTSKTFFALPLWIALEKGFFTQEGLDIGQIEIIGNEQRESLLTGKLDVTLAPVEAVVQDTAQNGPLRAIAGNAGKLSHILIAQPRFRKVEDLRGGVIGILNKQEGTFFQLQTILGAHGLHYPADYTVVDTGGVPPRHKALIAGTIDAGLQSFPWSDVEVDMGFSNLAKASDYIPDWQFTTYNVNSVRAASQADALAAFLRAVRAATEWMFTQRDGSVALLARHLEISEDYALRAWSHYTGTQTISQDLSYSDAGMRRVIAAQKAAGLLLGTAPDDPGAYFDLRYLDLLKP